jgi:hypothetical protein
MHGILSLFKQPYTFLSIGYYAGNATHTEVKYLAKTAGRAKLKDMDVAAKLKIHCWPICRQ